jgi:hypothetical protein
MSLFVTQQNLPFQAVIEYLQVMEPSSPESPADWARKSVANLTIGDVLFILEPIYSPWGDSSTGIGVADGDSFRVDLMAILYKRDEANALQTYALQPDIYERHELAAFLQQQGEKARQNGQGLYYLVIRPQTEVTAEKVANLSQLETWHGNSGWRADDSQQVDVAYAFLNGLGMGLDVGPGTNMDYALSGYLMFADKEPPPGSRLPDLRGRFQPLMRMALPDTATGAASAPVGEAPVETAAEEPASSAPPVPSMNALKGAAPSMRRIIPSKAPMAPQAPGMSRPGAPQIPAPGGLQRLAKPAPAAPAAQSEPAPVAVESEAPAMSELPPAFDITAPPAVPPVPGEAEAPPPVVFDAIAQGASPTPTLPEPEARAEEEAPSQQQSTAAAAPKISFPKAPKAGVPPIPGGGRIPPKPITINAPKPPLQGGAPGTGGVRKPPTVVPPMPQAPVLEPAAEAPVAPPLPVEAPAPEPVEPPAASEPVVEAPPASPDSDVVTQDVVALNMDEVLSHYPEPTADAAPADEKKDDKKPAYLADSSTAADLAAQLTAVAKAGEKPAVSAEAIVSEIAASLKQEDAAAETQTKPSVAPLPPKKKKGDDSARAQELQRQLKEPVAVKSGVAGLVSKLEQQASKASTKLEAQVEDTQTRLSGGLSHLLDKVAGSEKRSVKSTEGLRMNLTAKMEAATAEVKSKVRDSAFSGSQNINEYIDTGKNSIDEKHDYLRTSLKDSFDEVRVRAETLARSFEENSNAQSSQSLSELKQLMDDINNQFFDTLDTYTSGLQSSFDHFKARLTSGTTAITDALEAHYDSFEGETGDLHERCRERLSHIQKKSSEGLTQSLTTFELDIKRKQAVSLAEMVVPKLREYRDTLRAMTTEFQQKLAEDLESTGETKISEIEPLLAEKKAQLAELLVETTKIKDTIEERQRREFERIYKELTAFVDKSTEDAKTLFKSTEENIAEIDRAVRVLADPSSIESDMSLLEERNAVLGRMDESAEQATEEVTTALRTKVAALEERGKQLQEELISGMEEDAYIVRRASEQALNRIREAVKDSFAQIQTAQDERMD